MASANMGDPSRRPGPFSVALSCNLPPTAGGALATVRTAETGYTDNGNGCLTSNGVYNAPFLTAQFGNDLAGRVTRQFDHVANSYTVAYDR